MYFILNEANGLTTAAIKPGTACRILLEQEGVSLPKGQDPIAFYKALHNDQVQIIRLQKALHLIADSEPDKAKALAKQFADAVEAFDHATK